MKDISSDSNFPDTIAEAIEDITFDILDLHQLMLGIAASAAEITLDAPSRAAEELH